MWLNWWSYNGRFTLPSLDYVGRCNVITRVLIRGRQGFREERRYSVVVFEDGGRSHKPGNVGNLQNLEKARKQKVPWCLQKKCSPANTLNICISILKFICLFLVALALCRLSWAFPSCGEWGLLFVVINGLLIVVASLVVEHRLSCSQACGIFPHKGLN